MGIRPALGNCTIQEACHGRSINTDLCIQILQLFIDTNKKPQNPVFYNLLPLSDFWVKLQKTLIVELQMTGNHLQFLFRSESEANGQPVIALFNKYLSSVRQLSNEQQDDLPTTLTRFYENYYSPSSDSKIVDEALALTSKESSLPIEELDDIISLLLRHTKGIYNDIALNGIILQLCNIRSSLYGMERIRTRMLHCIVNEMAKSMRKRNLPSNQE